jgi:hypothetical protein
MLEIRTVGFLYIILFTKRSESVDSLLEIIYLNPWAKMPLVVTQLQ